LRRAFFSSGDSAARICSGDSAANPTQSDDLKRFAYTPGELAQMGERAGWRSDYIGEWGHPRGQLMMRFLAT